MNKRLMIIFVCIAVFVLTLVLGAVIFTINDVDILLLSEQQSVSFDKGKILATSGIRQGQSIFTIDEEQAALSIEKDFPKLKVVKIERIFPNKVRVNLDTRKPVLKLQAKDTNKCLVLDRELKVIDIVDLNNENYNEKDITILNNYSFELKDEKQTLGSFLSSENQDITDIVSIIRELEKFEVVNERFCATLQSIDITYNKAGRIGISLNTRLGKKIFIRTNTNITASNQCQTLYREFCYNISGEVRERNEFMYIDNGGQVVHSAQLVF